MLGERILKSRGSDEWQTPPSILKHIKNQGYKLDWDLACTHENVLKGCRPLPNFNEFSIEVCKGSMDSDKIAFCNPPYSKVAKFVEIIFNSMIPCILLLPARTDTRWFHNYIYNKPNVRVEFIKGRLKFSDSPHNAPFPSMLVYMNVE